MSTTASNMPAAPRPAPTELVRRHLKRRKGLSALSDAKVQDEDDQDIIVAGGLPRMNTTTLLMSVILML
ncbi:hypothetical protein FRC10_007247 [Ceratobasidium sp. 414]|nr:hypothetical protein FRC10_007247 [Ceratobasidium sp. 414]